MFCPKCSEPKANDETLFCTKCGFDISGMETLVRTGRGIDRVLKSERQKGIEHGVKLIILSVLIFPVYVFIGPLFPANDVLVESSPSTTWFEQIAWLVMWLAFLAGVARIAFAFVFEDSAKAGETGEKLTFGSKRTNNALPSGEAFQAANPGRWKTTDELLEPVMRKPRISGEL